MRCHNFPCNSIFNEKEEPAIGLIIGGSTTQWFCGNKCLVDSDKFKEIFHEIYTSKWDEGARVLEIKLNGRRAV